MPRTAVGATVLAQLSRPVIALGNALLAHVQGGDGRLNGTAHEQPGLGGAKSRSIPAAPAIVKLSQYIPSLSEGVDQQILGRYRHSLPMYRIELTP